MKYSAVEAYNDSELTELIKKLDQNEITDFFSDSKNIIHKRYVSDAVLLFTYALNQLDTIPSAGSRESHVLTGDAYFSEFYSALANHGEMQVVHDMVEISKDLSSRKSRQYENALELSDSELKYLLFAPLLYLMDNGYVTTDLDNVLGCFIQNMNRSELAYIINTKGEG
ncbi:hypothetical protein BN1048_00855 [Jeotgalicoccus saudimassiliensis]|uniref:Uncharacterized protein n=1 Tax=Jeotgalicoccus saudimassiliensis TaxID=1461582 RepID=A0A078M4E2_9STAP|nr:hypothetical protein [Jeotgalicoccus saudimassiliensis]CEA00182.1 hypothetical protein BN1048_00855 [Jeotgalicoccus saudimassiliensis]